MNTDKQSITDLLTQESFINYCLKNSAADEAFWENYINQHPDSAPLLEEAREKYIQLFNALAAADLEEQAEKLKNSLTPLQDAPVIKMDSREKSGRRKIWVLAKVAAAIAVVATAAILYLNYGVVSNTRNGHKTFTAVNGERKNFQLPDGSFITLNAGSVIDIKDDFGTATRDVYLKGEAFFDVKHNEKSPFIVHTKAMDVKALGTAFNVKAYQDEKTTETALIRGLVEVTLKEDNNFKMLLYPNQKVKWNNLVAATADKRRPGLKKLKEPSVADSLRKALVVSDDGIIKEIAWKQNKLVFDNEPFDDIAVSLERWYGAKIIIQDSVIRSYRFTGVFEKEDLNTVLDFLQESRNFNYTVVEDEPLTISLSK